MPQERIYFSVSVSSVTEFEIRTLAGVMGFTANTSQLHIICEMGIKCRTCGRQFRNKRALSGHLRHHPRHRKPAIIYDPEELLQLAEKSPLRKEIKASRRYLLERIDELGEFVEDLREGSEVIDLIGMDVNDVKEKVRKLDDERTKRNQIIPSENLSLWAIAKLYRLFEHQYAFNILVLYLISYSMKTLAKAGLIKSDRPRKDLLEAFRMAGNPAFLANIIEVLAYQLG